MASVSGSKLSFFSPNLAQNVNLILTKDGSDVTSSNLVAGAYNIEVFTSTPGSALLGVDATAFIQGAQTVSGAPSNEIQAGTPSSTEQLLAGNQWLVDHTGGEAISAASEDGVSQSVAGSRGDTITAGSGAGSSLLVDASNARGDVVVGPETIIGGGAQETVWAARGDSIVGGSGAMTIAGNAAVSPPGGTGAMTIIGGTGNLTVFDVGVNNSIVGSSKGSTFIDASYAGNAHNTITAGAGSTAVSAAGIAASNFIKAGIADSINGGSGGTVLVDGHVGTADTIDAASASGATVWGGTADSILGGTANLQFNDNVGGVANTVLGGSGGLFAFNLGTGDSIVGGSGGTVPGITVSGDTVSNFIDDSYANAKGFNTLVGGTGESAVFAGPNDSLIGGDGKFFADVRANLGATSQETIDLSTGAGAATVRDDATLGGTGTSVTVTGFDTAADTIASATSVNSGGTFTGSSTAQGGGTLLTFTDGTTMFLSGVTDLTTVHFIQ